jgi:integrase
VGNVLHFPNPGGDTATQTGAAEAAGKGPSQQKAGTVASADISLDKLIDAYTQERIDAGGAIPATARDQRLTLLQFGHSFGGRPVAKMGEADIIRWLGTTGNQRPATRRKKLSIVKGFTRWLAKHGHVRRDPSVDVKSPRQPRTVPKVFEGDAVAALLDACPDARARLIVLLMVQEGLRCAEVARLELGDIDGKLALIEGKGGHQRVVPLVAEVRSALDAYLMDRGGHAGPLIENQQHTGRGLTPHTVSDLVRRLCRAAGIKRYAGDGISAHGLRRTCASDLAERDVALLDIAEAFGHQSIETTRKHYTRHRAARLTTVMEGRWYGRQRIGKAG